MTSRTSTATIPTMETSTRYIGFCPVCQRQIKVRAGLLVHHGYERPGTGEILGDCFGVNRPPHELSPRTATDYLRLGVVPRIKAIENRIRRLGPPGEPEQIPFRVYNRATRDYDDIPRHKSEVNQYEWDQRLRSLRVQAGQELEYWQGEVKRLERLIATWQPEPLTTVEEEVAKAAETRAERARQRDVEREQRMAEALVSLRQRIDSAVRNKRPATIEDLFREGYRRLVDLSGNRLERDDVLRLLERDHVWRAFGLIRPDGSYLLDWKEVTKAFEPWSPWGGHEPVPFPAELGGGKVKLRR